MTQTMTASAARKASKKTQHVRSTGDWITLIVLIAAALLVLFPLLVLTVNAFKTPADYNATGPLSLPKHFTMDGIISFWTTTKFPLKFWNSLVISLVVAVAAVVLSVLNSFALGIGRVKGNTWIVLAIMLANMMPQEALLYPLYTMFKQVGLYNTKLAIIIIFTIIQSAYGTYLLSSVYGTFPQAILEAAAIDGASRWQILRKVVLPISWPTISVLFVFFFVWTMERIHDSDGIPDGRRRADHSAGARHIAGPTHDGCDHTCFGFAAEHCADYYFLHYFPAQVVAGHYRWCRKVAGKGVSYDSR